MDTVTELAAFDTQLTAELNTLWLMIGAILVFFMQTGFAMLEVGSVQSKNTRNILLKNVLDASLGAVLWGTVGFGLAMGDSNGYYGKTKFFLTKKAFSDGTGNNYAMWLFQWAFAATTATIVSGAVAERCTLTAYLVYTTCLVGFIYPLVAQIAWGSDGEMSPFLGSDDKDDYFRDCGVIDFAGSGVVHMTGGVAALVGCSILGPRRSFVEGIVNVPEYGPIFQTLGTLILWFGWYGFNAGSTLAIVGYGQIAAKAMVTTTASAACGAITALALGSVLDSRAAGRAMVKLEYANNGVLAGLVSITAGCAVVEPWGAAIIGIVGGLVYTGSSRMLKMCGIDDVVDAAPVHGFCGAWGVIAAALFVTKANYKAVYGIYDGAEDDCGSVLFGQGTSQLEANVAFVIFVLVWTGVLSTVVFGLLKCCGLLRVNAEVEEEGLDGEGTHHDSEAM